MPIILEVPMQRIGRFSIFPAPDGGATLMGAGFIKTYRRMDSARRHARKLAADDARVDAALAEHDGYDEDSPAVADLVARYNRRRRDRRRRRARPFEPRRLSRKEIEAA